MSLTHCYVPVSPGLQFEPRPVSLEYMHLTDSTLHWHCGWSVLTHRLRTAEGLRPLHPTCPRGHHVAGLSSSLGTALAVFS